MTDETGSANTSVTVPGTGTAIELGDLEGLHCRGARGRAQQPRRHPQALRPDQGPVGPAAQVNPMFRWDG